MHGEFASKEAATLNACFEAIKAKNLLAKDIDTKVMRALAHEIQVTPRTADAKEDRVAAFLSSFSAKKFLRKEEYLYASLKSFHTFW